MSLARCASVGLCVFVSLTIGRSQSSATPTGTAAARYERGSQNATAAIFGALALVHPTYAIFLLIPLLAVAGRLRLKKSATAAGTSSCLDAEPGCTSVA